MKNLFETHQLIILSKDSNVYKQYIEQAGFSNLSILATDEPEDAIRLGGESDLLFGDPFLACQVINLIPSVRWYQSSWAGIEALLLPGMRRDYLLTNARNVYGEMMSEYVFGYLLMIERQILPRWQAQLNQLWDERPAGRLRGKWIGLLGVGSIGAYLAITAHHFGMHVLGYTRVSETSTNVDQYFHGDEIFDFVNKLDYLVCSLPNTPATKFMINATLLSCLPTKAWLINIGRGSTMDETALVEALNYGKIGGAVLDVFDEEPLPEGHPFWHTPNTFITSHTAARNYLPDIAELFIENYNLLINGKQLKYQVNFDQHY
jgi:phosphoglycerate dehydrogenase-like enzyme